MLWPQFSIRELLCILAYFALGLSAMRIGGVVGGITLFVSLVIVMVLAINAILLHGLPRARAIGFIVPVMIYALVVALAGTPEFDPYEGRLPTTKALRPLQQNITQKIWKDMATGKIVPDYDPSSPPNQTQAGGGGFGFGGTVGLSEVPDRQEFMLIGHVLTAMIFGYFGLKYAAIRCR